MATSIVQRDAGGCDYPAANPATPDNVNGRSVLDYDATTDESADWVFRMPQHYGGGVLTLTIKCAMSSGTTGNVVVQAAVEANPTSIATDSFDTVNNSGQVAVPATAGNEFDVAITLTNKDGVAVGDSVRLRINRDANSTSATDDAPGDWELVLWEITEA